MGTDLGQVVKVNETTVQFIFSQPNFIFPEIVAQADQACGRGGAGPNIPDAPAEYLKQFHITFNANADVNAQAEGFSGWVDRYIAKDKAAINPERPGTRPWQLTTDFTVLRIVAERNPYFYAVDQEGNQLPYIDRLTFELAQDRDELMNMAFAGEIDFQGRHIALEDLPALEQNEDSGGYDVLTWPTFGGVDVRFAVNQNFDGSYSGQRAHDCGLERRPDRLRLQQPDQERPNDLRQSLGAAMGPLDLDRRKPGHRAATRDQRPCGRPP